ncbi:MAG: ribosome-recycling factor [bacterium]|nr:MAG: ribosome-recycling factor [bacterium]
MPERIEKESLHKMETTIGVLRRELAGIRTGRASAGILDSIKVDYYGTSTPIKQVASITVPDNRSISIQPWDAATLPLIEKAIQASDIGITPANDGKIIRLAMPPLSGERRKEIVKMVKKLGEDNKVAIRNIRRDGMDHAKKLLKAKEMSEDEERKLESRIQKLTNDFAAKVDSAISDKEKEILES